MGAHVCVCVRAWRFMGVRVCACAINAHVYVEVCMRMLHMLASESANLQSRGIDPLIYPLIDPSIDQPNLVTKPNVVTKPGNLRGEGTGKGAHTPSNASKARCRTSTCLHMCTAPSPRPTPPVPAPRPLPRTPSLILMPVACNAGRAAL